MTDIANTPFGQTRYLVLTDNIIDAGLAALKTIQNRPEAEQNAYWQNVAHTAASTKIVLFAEPHLPFLARLNNG